MKEHPIVITASLKDLYYMLMVVESQLLHGHNIEDSSSKLASGGVFPHPTLLPAG